MLHALTAAIASHERTEHPPLPGRTNHLRAGVAVPVREGSDGLEVWLTVRPAYMRRHPGQVSFPGGAPDDADSDLLATALRELEEEVGLPATRVLGRLSSMPLYTSDWRLEPFVVELPHRPPTPDPVEVAQILRIPLLELLGLDHIDAIPFDWDGQQLLSPVFMLHGHRCYGGTAYTLLELLELTAAATGRAVPPRRASGLTWKTVLAPPSR